jgi:hypothetical protein
MLDPITAFAAVQSAVKLIKQASKTVDDVSSLGPLIGKYFDAKHTATKAAREAKKAGGSNMGKAIEIELALKSQRDFEEQLKGLFFSSNNMDIWNSIQTRVQEMNAGDEEDARQERIRARKAKKEKEEMQELMLVIGLSIVLLILVAWGIVLMIDFCHVTRRCWQ